MQGCGKGLCCRGVGCWVASKGNEERLEIFESGCCSLGLALNGFTLFFNNLEEAQRSVFMGSARGRS